MKKQIIALALSIVSISAFAINKNTTQTDYLALKTGQDWTWQKIAQTPKIKWEQKIPKATTTPKLYSMNGDINKYTSLTAYGTKSQPNIVVIESSQSYKESEDGKDTYKVTDLFNKSELTPVKSNCTKKENQVNSGEYQFFYKWQKPGFQPLYVYEGKIVSGTFSGGISKEITIVKDFSDFNRLKSIGSIFDNYVGNENEIQCKLI